MDLLCCALYYCKHFFVLCQLIGSTDGSWGSWKGWSNCSRTCGVGTEVRFRKCDSPPPSNNGEYCHGKPVEVRQCNKNQCKLNHYFNPCFKNIPRQMITITNISKLTVFTCRSCGWFVGILGWLVWVFPELWWRNWDQAETLWQSSPGPGGERMSGGSRSGETVQHWPMSRTRWKHWLINITNLYLNIVLKF